MKLNALNKAVITIALLFSCAGVAFADTGFTGGSYDGYGLGVSVDFDLGGPEITISSAINQSFVTGQASTPGSSIIITDWTGGAITADNDLRITIPSGFGMEWDATKTFVAITGTASSNLSSAITYENSNKTLVLNVTSDFWAGASISLAGFSFTNFTASSAPDKLGLDIYNTAASYIKDDKYIRVISAEAGVLFAGNSYDGYGSSVSEGLLFSDANTDYFSLTSPSYQAIPGRDQTITITAKDETGSTITAYSPATSVTLAKSEAGGTLANSAALSKGSLLAADWAGGEANVILTDTESEDVTVVAVDQTYPSMTGTSIPITFSPGEITSYAVTNTTPQAAGVGWTETVFAKDAYNNTVYADSATVITMSSTGSAIFYTDNTYDEINSSGAYTLSSGQASIYIKDSVTETVNLTVTDVNDNTGSSGDIVIDPAPASKIVFTSSSQTMIAGVVSSEYAVQVQDQDGNLRSSDALTLTLSSSSANGTFDTSSGGSFDATITSITTTNGEGTFYYKDTVSGAPTITVSYTGLVSAAQAQTVNPAAASRASISSPASVIAGAVSGAFTITSTDAFGNTKAVVEETVFGLTSDSSGSAVFYNDPAGTEIITSVSIAAGASSAAFYYTDTKTASVVITAARSSGDTMTPSTTTGTIIINPGTKTKLAFKQQPPSTATINNILSSQPIVAVQDAYGNQTTDTDPVTIYASKYNTAYAAAPGTLTAAANPLSAVTGQADFSGVQYDTTGTIYLYAQSGTLQPAFSNSITFYTAGDSTVEAAAVPVTSFNLTADSSAPADKFAVLNFKAKDAGTDSVPTQIDRVQVNVGGTGVNASTDIAWAGLYQGTTQVAQATGASITNSTITFGAPPDSNSTAGLYSVPDNSSVEFTVYIYMKPGKLTAVERQTYTFGINETGIGADTGLSSRMSANTDKIATVSGTITVVVSYLEIVEQSTGSSSISVAPGSAVNLTIRGTDANKNIDKDYINNHVLIFSGLSGMDGYNPTMQGIAFGYSTAINFPVSPGGVSASGGAVLTAYQAEVASLSAREVGQDYSVFPLTVTVTAPAASAANISLASGDNQSGKASVALANPLIAAVTDTYGNAVSGASVTFAIFSAPEGATGQALSVTSATTGANGQAQTMLTLGSAAGQYQVRAESSGLAGSPVTFTATAVTPSTLNKISGDAQSKTVGSTLADPLVVKLVGAGNVAIPNETVTFVISSAPEGASGQALSVTSAVTDANGQAQAALTLGDKAGDYIVTAGYAGLASLNFTATGLAGAPYRIVLSGPGSSSAGVVSTAFSAIIRDSYDNIANAATATSFLLASNAATGSFYSDSAGSTNITSVTVAAGASSEVFYYKDTAIGLSTITASRSSGDTLNVNSSSAAINILAAGLDHFTVTGETTELAAGISRPITITAYDAYDNVKTNLNSDMSLVFSGANSSPAPSGNPPTCSNNLGNDINFGADTLLTFTNGAATANLKLYKAESVLIKASALPVTTSSAQALGFVVRHNTADHLKFSGTINAGTAGTPVNLGALNAVDLYNNLCDGANGGEAYAGSKTIGYVLSGAANAPDGSATDAWPANPVSFTNGVSAALSATLYRSQSTTITASAADLTGINTASNSVTIQAGTMGKLWFSQQPSTNPFTNIALPSQPKVNAADQYGNAVTTVSDQVSLLASLTSGTYTPVANGTLSGDSLAVVLTDGVATFSGIKYSYPESIYLKAHSVGNLAPDIYSYQITFKAGADTAIAAGPLVRPSSISSLVYTDAAKLQVFDFKVTDVGSDGYATKLKQIVIARNTAADTTDGWQGYIAGASISDGSTSIMGTITNDALTFGTGTSIISSVPDGQSKTYTLSIYLNQTLPAAADGKIIAFSLNPAANLTIDPLGSAFAASSAITGSLAVDVTATKFMVSADSSVMAAGSSSAVAIRAADINSNIDTDYSGVKEIIFSGANSASSSGVTYNPTCTNYSTVDIVFGNITLVNFTAGESSSVITMKLYKAESAAIKATTSDSGITTADALSLVVTGGSASKLSWSVQPELTVVAGAPWRSFKVSVVDTYGNVAPSAINVTVTPSGGFLSSGATAQVATVSGIATFDNFAVSCPSYPGTVTLNAASDAIASSGSSDNITVVEKYGITIKAYDSVNGSSLTEITLKIIDSSSGQLASGLTNPIIGNSPFSFNLPYGEYSFNFNKTAYVESTVDKTANVSADAVDGSYDNNIGWTVFLTSTAESLADYSVLSNFVYDEDNDRLTGLIRLEKRGQQITSNEINTLKTGTLNIFDSSDADSPKYSALLSAPDEDGNYYFNIDKAVTAKGFISGRDYFAKMTILYGGSDLSTNVTYSAANDFTISISSTLNTLAAQIAASVASEAALTRSELSSKIESTASATQAKVAEVNTQAGQILTATGTTIPSQITTAQTAITDTLAAKVEPQVKSGILNRENLVKQGNTATIRYRAAASGLVPLISVYSPKGALLIGNKAMGEVGLSGIYEYSVKFLSSWGRGDFSVICSDPVNGTVDALTMTVSQEDIESVSSSVSAVLGNTGGMTDLKTATSSIVEQFSNMDVMLAKISKEFTGKLVDAKSTVNDLSSAFKQLEDLSKQIKDIGGTTGVNLEKLYEVSKDKKEDITYIKNKSEELKAAMELNQKLIENQNKKPIVQTWFEFR